jgi:hypothetical protein
VAYVELKLLDVRNLNREGVQRHGNEAAVPDKVDDLAGAFVAERPQSTFSDQRRKDAAA